MGVIHSLEAASIPVSVNNIVLQLTNHIIDVFDGRTSLFVYKATWINRIVHTLKSTRTLFV